MKPFVLIGTVALALASPAASRADDAPDALVERLLRAEPQKLDTTLAAASTLRLQILYTEVDLAPEAATLTRHAYREGAEYFYPASALKIYGALAALEKLAELRASRSDGEPTRTTPARFYPLDAKEPPFAFDPSNADGGKATLGHEIRKALIGSDNESFNRLYSFVGQKELNERMWNHDFTSVRIAHRMGYVAAPAEARAAPRVDFVASKGAPVTLPLRTSFVTFEERAIPGLFVGSGYLENGRVVATPMSFATKNRVSLRDLQDVLLAVVHPEVLPPKARPKLDAEDREALLDALRTLPRESKSPAYDPVQYTDALSRPMLPGILRVAPASRLDVVGKSGRAYGFTVENIFVADRTTRRAFAATAVIYTNSDEILNDDLYDYSQASSVLADVGEILARHAFRDAPKPKKE